MIEKYFIEPLTSKHDRDAFDCGEASLNTFVKQYARQNDAKGLGRTFVAVRKEDPRVHGYYTISSNAIGFENVPENLPRYPVPVVHIGRLAVDVKARGSRLGSALLADALKRSMRIAEQLGIYAVEVFALNESARQFYLKFGFTELLDNRLHLYISVKKIRKLLD